MDDNNVKKLFFVWLSSALLGISATAAELEVKYISPVERQTFEQKFGAATSDDATLLSRIVDRAWSCDMFGMRTQMQVQRETKLYDFHHLGKTWKNSGALPVPEYLVEKGALVGQSAKVRDEVRMTGQGQLITKLSTRPALKDGPATVIAYSLCRPI